MLGGQACILEILLLFKPLQESHICSWVLSEIIHGQIYPLEVGELISQLFADLTTQLEHAVAGEVQTPYFLNLHQLHYFFIVVVVDPVVLQRYAPDAGEPV